MTTIGTEIDYKVENVFSGKYTHQRVLPQTSMPMTLQTSSVTEAILEVPNRVWNPAKSKLQFTVTYAAPGVGLHTRLHSMGLTMIDHISLESREGASIARISNCAQYSRATTCAYNKLENFLTNDSNRGGSTAASVADFGHNLARSNAAGLSFAAVDSTPFSENGLRLDVVNDSAVPGSVNYTEPTYFMSGGDNGVMVRKYSIPLSAFHGTALAMDKDLFFNQNLILKINFSAANQHGFVSAAGGLGGGVAISATATVSNYRLLQAVEVDPVLVSDIVGKVQSSGMELVVPYVHTYVQSTSALTTDIQVTQRFTRQHGQRLLHVISALYKSDSSGIYCLDIDNKGSRKIESFQSRLNNNNLTEFRPSVADGDDYEFMKTRLSGSVIQNRSVYNYNRMWCDSWRRGAMPEYPMRDSNQEIEGVNLDEEQLYDIQLTTPSGQWRHLLFACCQRTLSIAPNGLVNVV